MREFQSLQTSRQNNQTPSIKGRQESIEKNPPRVSTLEVNQLSHHQLLGKRSQALVQTLPQRLSRVWSMQVNISCLQVHTEACGVQSQAYYMNIEEETTKHLPLSLFPSDGTLQLELSHVCACVSVLKEIGGRMRAGSADERESQVDSCTRTRGNPGGRSIPHVA